MLARLILILVISCLAIPWAGWSETKRDRRQRETLEELLSKLERRHRYPNPTADQVYLHEQAEILFQNTRAAREDHYRFGRLARATDSLLEASERIKDAPRQKDDDEDAKREAAQGLQNDYFRLQQAEYYAAQINEQSAAEYVKLARRLYQQARREYDAGQYDMAETLGDSVSYVVNALEALAQAAIRIPEPPRIE